MAVGLPTTYLPSQSTFTVVPVPLNWRIRVLPFLMSRTQPERLRSPTVPVRTLWVASVLAAVGSIKTGLGVLVDAVGEVLSTTTGIGAAEKVLPNESFTVIVAV